MGVYYISTRYLGTFLCKERLVLVLVFLCVCIVYLPHVSCIYSRDFSDYLVLIFLFRLQSLQGGFLMAAYQQCIPAATF